MAAAPRNERLAILTNGGGTGIIATDLLMDEGGELASLLPRTLGVLDKALPRAWSHGNPVDIVGDADGARYAAALDALADDRGVGAVLAMNVPTALTSSVEAARAVAGARRRQGRAGDRLLDRRAGGAGRPPCAARGRHPGLRHAAARGARLHAHRAIPPRPARAPAHAAVGAAGALRHRSSCARSWRAR